MSRPRATGLWIVLATAALPAVALAGSSDTEVAEVRRSFVERVEKMIEGRRWAELFHFYREVLGDADERARVVPVQEGSRWIGVGRWFLQRLGADRLPREAWEVYRARYDQEPLWLLQRYRETHDEALLQAIVELHPFSSCATEAAVLLAARWTDAGRWADAADVLERMLRWHPDPGVPRSLIAARLAIARFHAGDAAGLQNLAGWLEEQGVEGSVVAGETAVSLRQFVADRIRSLVARGDVGPTGAGDWTRPPLGVDYRLHGPLRISVWTDDLPRADIEGAPRSRPQGRRDWVRFSGMPAPRPPVPAVPACARYGDRSVVLWWSDGPPEPNPSQAEPLRTPRLVALDPASGKPYWLYDVRPVVKAAVPRNAVGVVWWSDSRMNNSPPVPGVVVDGDEAFFLLPTQARVWNSQGRFDPNRDQLPAYNRVVCIRFYDAPSGRIVRRILWDTDLYFEDFGFGTVRWTAHHPIVVCADRVYLAASTLEGSVDAHVICLDRKTGRPLWKTFIAGRSSIAAQFGQGVSPPQTYPALACHGGTLYVASNVGVVAALSAADGALLWMTAYPTMRADGSAETAHPSPPIVYDGRVHVLPSDGRPGTQPFVVLDARTGEPLDATRLQIRSGRAMRILPWGTGRFVGVRQLAPQGSNQNQTGMNYFVVDLRRWADPSGGLVQDSGAALPAFVPAQEPVLLEQWLYGVGAGGTVTGVFLPGMRLAYQKAMPGGDAVGHFAGIGPYLVLAAAETITVFAGDRGIDEIYGPRIAGETPDLDALFEYATVKHRAGRMDDAGRAFARFLELAGDRPEYAQRVLDARRGMFDAWWSRAETAGTDEERERALAEARRFAPDSAAHARVARALADVYVRTGRRHDALREMLAALREDADYMVETARGAREPLWRSYERTIRQWTSEDRSLLEELDAAARQALDGLTERTAGALMAIRRRFPSSAVVLDAMAAAVAEAFDARRFEDAAPLWRVLEDADPRRLGPEIRRRWIEWLESSGAVDRARRELQRLKELFGSDPMSAPQHETGQDPRTWGDWVDERLAALAVSHARESRTELRERVRMGAARSGRVAPMWNIEIVPRPLMPAGPVPAGFPDDAELIAQGSALELRRLSDGSTVWSLPRPTPHFAQIAIQEGRLVAGRRQIARIAGEPARPESLMRILAACFIGARVPVEFEDGGSEEWRAEEAPPNSRPSIVGAAFNGLTGLVVAWEDCLAEIDWRDGRVRWVRPIRHDGIRNAAVAASAQAVFAIAVPFVWPSAQTQESPTMVPAPGAPSSSPNPLSGEHMLVAIETETGDLLWEHKMEGFGNLDASVTAIEARLRVNAAGTAVVAERWAVSSPDRPQIEIRRRGVQVSQQTAAIFRLRVACARADGTLLNDEVPQPQGWGTWDVDVERGVLYRIAGASMLQVVDLGGGDGAGRASVRLSPPRDPQRAVYTLAALSDGVFVWNAGDREGSVYRWSEGSLRPFRRVWLREGAEFQAPQRPTPPFVLEDGTIGVYGVRQLGNTAGWFGSLVLFPPVEGADPVVFASVPASLETRMKVDCSIPGLIVLAVSNGMRGRERVHSVHVISTSTNRIVPPQIEGMSALPGIVPMEPAVWTWRGRLFVARGQQLVVYE